MAALSLFPSPSEHGAQPRLIFYLFFPSNQAVYLAVVPTIQSATEN